jgi:hypothetical protein
VTTVLPRKAAGASLRPAADETLLLLSAVLKTAFRLHCTGESISGKGPWQLVGDVQRKLVALSAGREGVLSEVLLTRFIETDLVDSRSPEARDPRAAEAA